MISDIILERENVMAKLNEQDKEMFIYHSQYSNVYEIYTKIPIDIQSEIEIKPYANKYL